MNGWIRLEKNIVNHWLWQDSEKLKAWLDLIMLANYEDKKTPYKGEVITCKRGDVNLSISYLAKRWNWSRDKTKRFLELLEDDEMVTTKTTTHRTTITLINYGKYQDAPATNKATNKATSRQQADTTNNNNNINKYNNIRPLRKNAFSDFEQNEYDFDELEKELLKNE